MALFESSLFDSNIFSSTLFESGAPFDGLPYALLDFMTPTLDARITFTRASPKTYIGSDGARYTAGINESPLEYDPVTLQPIGRSLRRWSIGGKPPINGWHWNVPPSTPMSHWA